MYKETRQRIAREKRVWHRVIAIVWLVIMLAPAPVWSQTEDPSDELGNWLIYNGTVRFSDEWSVFTEAQLRLYRVASELEEVFGRVAGHYDFAGPALVGFGYMHSAVWPPGRATDERPRRNENRLYEQFTLWQHWARAALEHRYRLEQRWFDAGGTTSYANRFRYRLQVTHPINNPEMVPGTVFINAYNEIFVRFASGERAFDQNRLYGAAGYKFAPNIMLQLGLLWQARSSADFLKLQIFYTHNFDLR